MLVAYRSAFLVGTKFTFRARRLPELLPRDVEARPSGAPGGALPVVCGRGPVQRALRQEVGFTSSMGPRFTHIGSVGVSGRYSGKCTRVVRCLRNLCTFAQISIILRAYTQRQPLPCACFEPFLHCHDLLPSRHELSVRRRLAERRERDVRGEAAFVRANFMHHSTGQ